MSLLPIAAATTVLPRPVNAANTALFTPNLLPPNLRTVQKDIQFWDDYLRNRVPLNIALHQGCNLNGLAGERFKLGRDLLKITAEINSKTLVASLVKGYCNMVVDYNAPKAGMVYSHHWFSSPYVALARGEEICAGQSTIKYEFLRATKKFSDQDLAIMGGDLQYSSNGKLIILGRHANVLVFVNNVGLVLDHELPSNLAGKDFMQSLQVFLDVAQYVTAEDYFLKYHRSLHAYIGLRENGTLAPSGASHPTASQPDASSLLAKERLKELAIAEGGFVFQPDFLLNEKGAEPFDNSREGIEQWTVRARAGFDAYRADVELGNREVADKHIWRIINNFALRAIDLRRRYESLNKAPLPNSDMPRRRRLLRAAHSRNLS